MFRRFLTNRLLQALGRAPLVFLAGARQTGKSTLARSLADAGYRADYVTFDDPSVLLHAKRDPVGFLADFRGPAILDEVQRAPELFPVLKMAVDTDRRPGRFLLTGSANVLLLPKLAEFLVGRMEILTLWPLSQAEIAGPRGVESFLDRAFSDGRFPAVARERRESLVNRILVGGFPEVQTRGTDRDREAWFDSYLRLVTSREVQDLANLDGLLQIPPFLTLLAGRTAALQNLSDFSRTLGVPLTTLNRYLALLERSFLVHTIPAWSGSRTGRLARSPKRVLTDTGLAAHLIGVEAGSLGESRDSRIGPLLENFVGLEILKQCGWSDVSPALTHFRTHPGAEVDLVLDDRRRGLVGIEIKAAATVSPRDTAGLRKLAELAGPRFRRGIVLYTGSEVLPLGDRIDAVPVNTLWD